MMDFGDMKAYWRERKEIRKLLSEGNRDFY
jgi:hypothetical protein